MIQFPPLPYPECHDNGDIFGVPVTYLYTADQLRAYAAADREALAAYFEASTSQVKGALGTSDPLDAILEKLAIDILLDVAKQLRLKE